MCARNNNRARCRGGSAGGFTVLNALTFHDEFSAGSSHFGIGDLASMFQTTHKFEASYDQWLIGRKESSKAISEQPKRGVLGGPKKRQVVSTGFRSQSGGRIVEARPVLALSEPRGLGRCPTLCSSSSSLWLDG